MKHLRNVVRDSRSVARAPHIEVCTTFRNVYQFRFAFLAHNNPLTIMHLTQCVPVVPCGPACSKLYLRVFKIDILFSKSNFNLDLGGTHGTHLSSPRGC